MSETDDLLTSAEVAARLRVHRATVLRWAREGRVKAIRLPGRGLRFRASELDAILTEDERSAAAS